MRLLDSQPDKNFGVNSQGTEVYCCFRMALDNCEQFSFLLTVKPDLFQCPFKMKGISEIFKIIKRIFTIRKKKK